LHQESIENLTSSVISDNLKNNKSIYQSIIEKTTQANSCDLSNSNADDLYQMIQENMKEFDEIKNMLSGM